MRGIVGLLTRLWSTRRILGALATDAAGELDVLRHDGDALGMDRAQVGVLEEANQVGLGGGGHQVSGELRRRSEAESKGAGARWLGTSEASWRATTADDWKRRSVLKS